MRPRSASPHVGLSGATLTLRPPRCASSAVSAPVSASGAPPIPTARRRKIFLAANIHSACYRVLYTKLAPVSSHFFSLSTKVFFSSRFVSTFALQNWLFIPLDFFFHRNIYSSCYRVLPAKLASIFFPFFFSAKKSFFLPKWHLFKLLLCFERKPRDYSVLTFCCYFSHL